MMLTCSASGCLQWLTWVSGISGLFSSWKEHENRLRIILSLFKMCNHEGKLLFSILQMTRPIDLGQMKITWTKISYFSQSKSWLNRGVSLRCYRSGVCVVRVQKCISDRPKLQCCEDKQLWCCELHQPPKELIENALYFPGRRPLKEQIGVPMSRKKAKVPKASTLFNKVQTLIPCHTTSSLVHDCE